MNEDNIIEVKTQDPNTWGLDNASLPKVFWIYGVILPITVSILLTLIYGVTPVWFIFVVFGYYVVWTRHVFYASKRRNHDMWGILAVIYSVVNIVLAFAQMKWY